MAFPEPIHETAEQLGRLYKISESAPAGRQTHPPERPRRDIDDELVRHERLKNDDVEQNITLKRVVLDRLFWFLGVETTLIFLCAVFQATHWLGFRLEDWSFDVLVTATIAQITGMLFVAVRYLFPKGDR